MTECRMRYKDIEPSSGDVVMVEVQIDYSEDGTTWDPLDGGDVRIGVSAAEILAVTRDGTITDAEKLTALNALLQERIRALGLTDSRDAAAEMEALLPNGWPITAAL